MQESLVVGFNSYPQFLLRSRVSVAAYALDIGRGQNMVLEAFKGRRGGTRRRAVHFFFPYCSPLWCSAPAACGQLVLPLLSSWLQSTQVSETAWIRTFSPTPALHLHPNFDVHLLKRSRRLFNRSSKTSVVILAACQGFMEKIKSSFFFFFYSFIFSRGC